MGRTVLVTGAARYLGGPVLRALLREPDVDRAVGVDVRPPAGGPGGAEFLRADIRLPEIARAVAASGADTVVHLTVSAAAPGAAGRNAAKETDVIGTMQLLAACTRTPSIKRFVVTSTTGVYGSAPRDPAVFTEETQARALPPGGHARDAVEAEGYVRGFARRRPDVAVCVLRFADILGPAARSPLARYFALPVLPTVLGHDPRLQFVHEDDAVEAVRRAALRPGGGARHDGTFNVAGDGVLLLSQAARRLGRPTLPLPPPAVSATGRALRLTGAADVSPEQIRLLTHGRVVDTTRLREVFGFVPARTTAETFADFARGRAGALRHAAALLHAAAPPTQCGGGDRTRREEWRTARG